MEVSASSASCGGWRPYWARVDRLSVAVAVAAACRPPRGCYRLHPLSVTVDCKSATITHSLGRHSTHTAKLLVSFCEEMDRTQNELQTLEAIADSSRAHD